MAISRRSSAALLVIRAVSSRFPSATYQRVLNDHLHALGDAGRFAQTIVVADRPILDVQHDLRVLLRDPLGLSIPGLALHRYG